MTDKRLIFLILLSLVTFSPLFAQRFGGGLMVGANISTMNISGNDSTRFRPDFTGGVRIALIPERSIFGAEIDVLYSRQGTSSKKWVGESNTTLRYLEKSHYITMPLLLNIYLRNIGGNEVKEIKGKRKQQFITPWEKGSFNRIDYGVTAAVSYWFIEVRYTFGMANVFKEGEKSTNHVISVTWSDIW